MALGSPSDASLAIAASPLSPSPHPPQFCHIWAWELTTRPGYEFWDGMDTDTIARTTFFNFGVGAEPRTPTNPIDVIKAVAKPDDYVVFKLDIVSGAGVTREGEGQRWAHWEGGGGGMGRMAPVRGAGVVWCWARGVRLLHAARRARSGCWHP